LKINFFTIVYNGMPFIKHHIQEFEKTKLDWHWHIVEGLADLKHDTAWSISTGGEITEGQRKNNLSKDGTSEYISSLKKEYPNNITVYRKENALLWDGKIEMIMAPLNNIKDTCLLWQIDCDEHWNFQQIRNVYYRFAENEEKTAAWFWCNYYVGNNIRISTRNCYSQNPNQEWLRVWKFHPGDNWTAHEPPVLIGERDRKKVDIGRHNPFMHDEMENIGAVFEHYAYVAPEQLKFKETYYGYKGALAQWQKLQEDIESRKEVRLGDYLSWVKDNTTAKKTKKTKIVFVDHDYHKTTQSSKFFFDIISSMGDTQILWDRSHETPNAKFNIDAVRALKPDIVIIWQSEKAAVACASCGFKNVIFIPMYDSAKHASEEFWRKIKCCKVINFSLKTYNECILHNIESIYVQYFLKPETTIGIDASLSRYAFFWQRREIPNINTIRPFLKYLGVKKLLFHNVPDPCVKVKRMPTFFDKIKYSIKESKWFNSAADFKEYVKNVGIYFAPRLEEGIGLSFLEALANGQCVIAPDRSSMNEYITNGVNGILYSEVTGISKSWNIEQLRNNAIRTSVNGYKNWQDGKNQILRFIYGRNQKYKRRRFSNRINLTKRASSKNKSPKVSVCIVVKNAEKQIEKTLESILAQDYPNLEIIVKDGCSTDGTLKVLERYRESIDLIHSTKDNGIYDGMNQAVAFATGEWVIYMNAGDGFFCKRCVSNSFRGLNIPSKCGLIIGNNILIDNISNSIKLEKSIYIEDTLKKIKKTDYHDALFYFPCHQSVFTRKELLLKYKYDPSLARSADHDFYLKIINDGYISIHTGEIISNYLGGGFSVSNEMELLNEWESIDIKYSNNIELTKKHYSNLRARSNLIPGSAKHDRIIKTIHDQYQNTLSWKITKPLRIAAKYMCIMLRKRYNDLDAFSIRSFK